MTLCLKQNSKFNQKPFLIEYFQLDITIYMETFSICFIVFSMYIQLYEDNWKQQLGNSH